MPVDVRCRMRAISSRFLLGGLLLAVAGGAPASDRQDWVDEQVASGAALAIVVGERRGGATRHYAGGSISPADTAPAAGPDTQFQIGSVTKAFTHLLLAEMTAAGDVDYDTTLGELLGERGTGIEFANAAVAETTLLELATHTSGLPRLPANLTPADAADPYRSYGEAALLAGLAAARQKQPLGDHYAYSNFGAGLLGWLLGRVEGSGYEAALRERVLNPLGLDSTTFEPAGDAATGYRSGERAPAWSFDALAAAGALWSTSTDLMRLTRWYLDSAVTGLRHDPAADLEIVVERAGPYRLTRVWHMAASAKGPVYWHSGRTGGYGAFLGFRPATGEAVTILVSGDTDPTAAGLEWLGGEPRPADAPAPDTTVTGQYRVTPQFGIGVFASGGRLLAQASGQPPLSLTPLGDDWYAIDVADASVHFVRGEGGTAAVALELVQNGVVQRAEKVAEQAATAGRTEKALPREALVEYTGEYAISESARFTIRLGDEGLEVRLTGQPFLPVYPGGDDRFFYRAVDADLLFERDADGRVDALVLHQGPIRQRAERVDR